MHFDLNQTLEDLSTDEADVCIVGSGVAGLLLAHRLLRSGLRVVVLETGGPHAPQDDHPLNEVVQLGRAYQGAAKGRARCVGGTSTIWGGALLPFLPFDMRGWPVNHDAVARHIPEVERLLALDAGSYEVDFLETFGDADLMPAHDADFLPRFAKWPAFRRRNFAHLFRAEIAGDVHLRLWRHAHVVDFSLVENGAALAAVWAKAPSGRTLKVAARHFALCAGAIESTRLLLWFDQRSGGVLQQSRPALGRYFHDHVSVVAADWEVRDAAELNRIAGFRFVGSTMRSLRFELSPLAQAAEGVASAFGHIHVATDHPTPFDAVRDILRAWQRGGGPPLAALRRAALGAPELARIALWRIARRQLRWPQPADHQLHVVVEQQPTWRNAIGLAERRDRHDVPLASIDWRIGQQQARTLLAFARRFDAFWMRHGLARAAIPRWRDLEASLSSEAQSSDVFHPGGSTRMAETADAGVVDSDLQVFGLQNLYVASTSVFPSGASANPTLMLMLFVCRLADRLTSRH